MKITSAMVLFVVSLCFWRVAMAIESPKYIVIEKDDQFETRDYEPYIVAEKTLDGDFNSASNLGFRRLAGYIFGANTLEQKIAMTAPVGIEQNKSEKIAMTAPVGQTGKDGKYNVTFSMPNSYTLQTLPTPNDKTVTLRAIPKKRYASLRFSGTWSQSRFEEHLALLRDWIKKKGFQIIGEPTYARYNPPWTPWFMRRNEILIEISR